MGKSVERRLGSALVAPPARTKQHPTAGSDRQVQVGSTWLTNVVCWF